MTHIPFHEIRFPARLSFGSVGGPERLTEIVTLANGHEERNSPWEHSRRRYDAGVGMRSMDDIAELVAFFEARRARLHGFRWKDWADYKSGAPTREPDINDQLLGTGNGVQTVYTLSKTYRSGENTYVRPITKPVAGTVKIGLSDDPQIETIDYDVDIETGTVTLFTPPAEGVEVTAGYEFDVPVRFDTDAIRTSMASFEAGEIPDVPVVELRL